MIGLRPLTLLAVLACICTMTSAHSGETRQDYRSPDGKLIATVIDVNKAHESRVEMRNMDGKLLLVMDYSSIDMEHGQVILKAAWTPDGMFFVFSMENTGGHSPLGRPKSFYSRQRNRLYSLDQAVGCITDSEFELQPPNWVITKRLNTTDEESRPLRVALSTLVK